MHRGVSAAIALDHRHASDHEHEDDHGHGPHRHEAASSSGHGHSHGLVDRSITRSRAGVRAVLISLAVLTVAAVAQVAVFVLSDSVALLADLIHNFGDA